MCVLGLFFSFFFWCFCVYRRQKERTPSLEDTAKHTHTGKAVYVMMMLLLLLLQKEARHSNTSTDTYTHSNTQETIQQKGYITRNTHNQDCVCVCVCMYVNICICACISVAVVYKAPLQSTQTHSYTHTRHTPLQPTRHHLEHSPQAATLISTLLHSSSHSTRTLTN